jgi:hypothetical protein
VTPFRAERPWCIAAPLRPFAHGALQSRTLRNTRSRAPQTRRRLSPSVLVPRPWSQGVRGPFEAHHPTDVAEAFASTGPLSRLRPVRRGGPRRPRPGASGCFTDRRTGGPP